MSPLESQNANRPAPPDVFTVLLVVSTLLMAVGVAWMVLVNSEHSTVDSKPGGPITLVDLK
jgi:hypothetical protein